MRKFIAVLVPLQKLEIVVAFLKKYPYNRAGKEILKKHIISLNTIKVKKRLKNSPYFSACI